MCFAVVNRSAEQVLDETSTTTMMMMMVTMVKATATLIIIMATEKKILHHVQMVCRCVRVTSFIICLSMQWQWKWRCVAIVRFGVFTVFFSQFHFHQTEYIRARKPKNGIWIALFSFSYNGKVQIFHSLLFDDYFSIKRHVKLQIFLHGFSPLFPRRCYFVIRVRSFFFHVFFPFFRHDENDSFLLEITSRALSAILSKFNLMKLNPIDYWWYSNVYKCQTEKCIFAVGLPIK